MVASTARRSVFDVESFIREYYGAWSGTDEDLILSYYAENVVLQIPGTLLEGKEALRHQFVRPFITAFPGNRHLVKNMIFGSGVVVVEFSFEAQHKGPFGGHVATGARVKLPGCGVYEYDAVKRQITAGRIYFDVGTLLQTITDSLMDDRKQAEEALRTNERNLSLITNVIPTFIHVLRTDGSVLYVNQAVLGYTGLTLEDVRKEDYRARVFHPEDVERLREGRRDALTRPVPFGNEQRVLGKDGRYRWFLIRYNPLLDQQGRIDRWYCSAFDIEDRKRAEDDLRRSEAFLAETQHLSSVGSFCWRVRTDEITWSAETYRIFQLDQGVPVTLELIASRVHPDDLPLLFEMIDRVRHEANDFEYEHRVLLPDHSVKHLHLVAHGRRDRDGQLEYIGAVQDVTEGKAAEEALTRARSELARMGRVTMLSALTASIAHEINQPLSGIITNASTCLRMLDGNPPNIDGARETARRTIRDGNRAAEVISRVRALFSKKEFILEPLDLNEATREVIALSSSDLQRNRVILRSELADDLPAVTGDRVQLQQVILNLLRNASDAMVDVNDRPRELLVKTEREDGDRVRLAVRDTGGGLSTASLNSLFDAFYTTKSGGMGIGLFVSRSIIERHRGRLWAEPNEGAPGATFSCSIPRVGDGGPHTVSATTTL